MIPWKSPLLGTFLLSLLLLVGVTAWLLTDPATSRSDALKTGGLAGGAVVALYALWLNDRRRRVEERRQEVERQRQELESRRTDQDRDRVSDERFAKAVELLGHNADQVRVGALHALAGLAKSRESYRQTVLDILCSYLRRPFGHPRLSGQSEAGAENELQVRNTAKRCIRSLLSPASDVDAPAYNLDLTGAVLDYFHLAEVKVGELVMRHVTLFSSTSFRDCEFTGPVWFTGTVGQPGELGGRFHCQGVTFHDRAWFSGTEFPAQTNFEGTTFSGETTFKDAVFSSDAVFKDTTFAHSLELRRTRFEGAVDLRFATPPPSLDLYNTFVDETKDLHLPPGWSTETLPDGQTRLVQL